MNNRPALVLDNCVLSSLHCSGWLSSISIWNDLYSLIVPHRVWETEFTPTRDINRPPEPISVLSVELSDTEAQVPGQLSKPDWSCIVAAEQAETSQLVTNDLALKNRAEDRELSTLWGTAFVIKTFRKCGISVDEFDDGLDAYIDDVTLKEAVIEELVSTEKPA